MENTAREQNGSTVNGVDVKALHNTISALRKQPEMGESRFRASNRWQGGALNQTEIGKFYCAGEERTHKKRFVFQNDEAHVLLGNDDGANPVEFVLHALAGCITTTTAYHAAARGIPIRSIETELEGELDLQGLMQTDPTIPCGYQKIQVTMKIKSDAPPEKIEELRTLFQYSPVFDTITRAVPVEVQVKI